MRAWAASAASSIVRGGRREVDDRVGVKQQGQRFGDNLEAARRAAGKRARIMAKPGRVLALERAGKREVGRLVDRAHDHAAHAARGAGDDDAQFGHLRRFSRQPGCGSVVALGDDEVDQRGGVAEFRRALVFLGFETRERRRIVGKFDDHLPRFRRALGDDVRSAAHQKARAVFGESDAIRSDVFLVAVGIRDLDMRNPIALRHVKFPRRAPSRCRPRPARSARAA